MAEPPRAMSRIPAAFATIIWKAQHLAGEQKASPAWGMETNTGAISKHLSYH
jgi:hypothetical protein